MNFPHDELTVVETYLTEARESKLFVHVFVHIIELQGEFQCIDVEMTQRVHYLPERG